jgi:hypothetical protein
LAFDLGIMNNVLDTTNIPFDNPLVMIAYNVIRAIILLLAGMFIADLVDKVVQKFFDMLKVEQAFKKYKVEDALGGNQVTPLLSTAAKWYVMLMFLMSAVEVLGLSSVTIIIGSMLMYAPVLIGVGLLILASAIIGEWVREATLDLHKFYMQKTVAEALKIIIVVMSVVVGLETIGFRMDFVREVFTTILQGIMYGFALAVGIAFGLGGQKDATEVIKKARKSFKA